MHTGVFLLDLRERPLEPARVLVDQVRRAGLNFAKDAQVPQRCRMVHVSPYCIKNALNSEECQLAMVDELEGVGEVLECVGFGEVLGDSLFGIREEALGYCLRTSGRSVAHEAGDVGVLVLEAVLGKFAAVQGYVGGR